MPNPDLFTGAGKTAEQELGEATEAITKVGRVRGLATKAFPFLMGASAMKSAIDAWNSPDKGPYSNESPLKQKALNETKALSPYVGYGIAQGVANRLGPKLATFGAEKVGGLVGRAIGLAGEGMAEMGGPLLVGGLLLGGLGYEAYKAIKGAGEEPPKETTPAPTKTEEEDDDQPKPARQPYRVPPTLKLLANPDDLQ